MNPKTKGREIALSVLFAVDLGKNSVPDAFLPFKYESPVSLEYALKLVQGTIENLSDIDEKIKSLLKNWSFERLNAVDKEILRLAIYEIENVVGEDYGIIVFEAVELAKKYGDLNSGDFVNGILRSFLRLRNEEVTT
ncbi:transcription antitermination factor NusB [Caldisericum exile]|uniref:Transcription antitermination protein NusB n=1 Tax=Caldisericum exile (strain DSM 21853 / NBRC 104410 / AZM16c01) TaxID=511051 RepID=A0A7U6GEI2_CALEA|nr:transcription antitermination factor NusB [Caldisericum exile]BAL80911.1 N utilization substance protein B homolog [Caldisericum exile AZM16c01]